MPSSTNAATHFVTWPLIGSTRDVPLSRSTQSATVRCAGRSSVTACGSWAASAWPDFHGALPQRPHVRGDAGLPAGACEQALRGRAGKVARQSLERPSRAQRPGQQHRLQRLAIEQQLSAPHVVWRIEPAPAGTGVCPVAAGAGAPHRGGDVRGADPARPEREPVLRVGQVTTPPQQMPGLADRFVEWQVFQALDWIVLREALHRPELRHRLARLAGRGAGRRRAWGSRRRRAARGVQRSRCLRPSRSSRVRPGRHGADDPPPRRRRMVRHGSCADPGRR